MRFTAFLAAGVFAIAASAQSSSVASVASSVSSAAAPTDSAQAAIYKCIEACDPSDVNCKAKCVAVPNPNESQVNQTTECAAKCPQGNGSQEQTEEFGRCVSKCIGQYYYSTSGGTPSPTQSSGSSNSGSSGSAAATATGTGASASASGTGSSASGTASSSASGTGSAASSSSSAAAAADSIMQLSSSVGLLGFLAALLAI